MFIHKFIENKIAKKNHKNLKYIYNTNLIKNFFKNQNFLLFFFFTNISKKNEIELQTYLKKENLKFLKIKKNLLLKDKTISTNFYFLNNLLKNNVMIIYNKDNTNFNYNVLKTLLKNSIKEIQFLGIWQNKKFVRPLELELENTLNIQVLQKNLCVINNYLKKKLVNYFSFKQS